MCILIQLPLAGKDFQEPLEVIDPLYPDAKDSSGFLTYGYCDISNTWYVVMNDSSSYYNRVLGAFTLLDINNDFALNAYYSTYLLVGPVLPGETPATAAEFWMNAVQFEYGFTGAARVLGWDIIFEYSRTSQHPLKSEYSQVTTDVLKTGFVAPRLILDNIMAIFWFRTGFVDLFDFWQSPVDKPRTIWIFSPSLHIDFQLLENILLYATTCVDMLLLRSGGFDADINTETGISMINGNLKMSLYMEYYHSGNSEILEDAKTPEDIIGIGFRLIISS